MISFKEKSALRSKVITRACNVVHSFVVTGFHYISVCLIPGNISSTVVGHSFRLLLFAPTLQRLCQSTCQQYVNTNNHKLRSGIFAYRPCCAGHNSSMNAVISKSVDKNKSAFSRLLTECFSWGHSTVTPKGGTMQEWRREFPHPTAAAVASPNRWAQFIRTYIIQDSMRYSETTRRWWTQ